jgi:hypothetical protein
LSQGKDPVGAIFGALGTGLTVAVFLGFFVTLAFAIADRSADARREIALANGKWTPNLLPIETSVESHDYRWSGPIAALVGNIFIIALLIIQRTASPVSTASGAPIPIISPELWDFWVWYFLGVLGVALVMDFVKLAVGRWRPWTAAIDTVLGIAGAVPLALLVWQNQVINPELHWTIAGNWVAVLVAVFILFLMVTSIAKLWREGRRKPAL